MRVYKKKTIRRMKWYGVILVLSGIPLGIGMGRSLEEGRTFLLEESQTYDEFNERDMKIAFMATGIERRSRAAMIEESEAGNEKTKTTGS